jgi:actin-related protein|eukprot:COSAG06_NODE_9169_length_1968_cov_36.979133_1_plen_52_part_00
MANVMLTGGNTLFEGLPQMLYKKLKSVRVAITLAALQLLLFCQQRQWYILP